MIYKKRTMDPGPKTIEIYASKMELSRTSNFIGHVGRQQKMFHVSAWSDVDVS